MNANDKVWELEDQVRTLKGENKKLKKRIKQLEAKLEESDNELALLKVARTKSPYTVTWNPSTDTGTTWTAGAATNAGTYNIKLASA